MSRSKDQPPKSVPEDDAALFRQAVDGVTPLNEDRVRPEPKKRPPPIPRHRLQFRGEFENERGHDASGNPETSALSE